MSSSRLLFEKNYHLEFQFEGLAVAMLPGKQQRRLGSISMPKLAEILGDGLSIDFFPGKGNRVREERSI